MVRRGRIFWDSVNVIAPWVAVSEPVGWIADRTDELVRRLSAVLGASGWKFIAVTEAPEDLDEPDNVAVPWTGSLEVLVASSEVVLNTPRPDVRGGFSFLVTGETGVGERVSVTVDAGASFVGRRLPRHQVSVQVTAASEGGRVPGGTAEVVVRAVAETFDPAMVDVVSPEVGRLARRGGWLIGPSFRLWLHDGVLSCAVLPEGMSAERVGAGWLYSVPDGWEPGRVVAVHEEFRGLNGLDVLPH